MPKIERAPKKAKKAPAEEVPEWATTTPEEIDYYLEMYDPNDEALQHVDLTRDEFIALKEHLAKMRGFLPEVAHA